MSQDNDWVGMGLCYYCNKPKEVLLHRRMSKTLPREAVYNVEPCHECAALMDQGILLISVKDGEMENEERKRKVHNQAQRSLPERKRTPYIDNPYRTGGWCVVTDDLMRRMLKPGELLDTILQQRVCFMPDKVWDHIGLPRE